MSERRHHEKEEKVEEKDRDQQEKEEKSWDEKWRNDPLTAAGWALFLIWVGLALLAENVNLLDNLLLDAGDLILVGGGVIVLGIVLIRLLIPAYRRPVLGSVIFAFVLLALGLGDLASWKLIWPSVIILLGLILLLRGALGRE